MSVDANVLIFERIKEEIRNGRPIQQAINEGYNGAFSSIFDANLTTILTQLSFMQSVPVQFKALR